MGYCNTINKYNSNRYNTNCYADYYSYTGYYYYCYCYCYYYYYYYINRYDTKYILLLTAGIIIRNLIKLNAGYNIEDLETQRTHTIINNYQL